jgi:hypothetical protein
MRVQSLARLDGHEITDSEIRAMNCIDEMPWWDNVLSAKISYVIYAHAMPA